MPEWLVKLLVTLSVPAEPMVEGDISEGSRNAHLTSLAGSMRRRGMGSVKAMEAALLEENTQRCSPPLGKDEVKTIARSVGRYPPKDDTNEHAHSPEPLRKPPQEAALAVVGARLAETDPLTRKVNVEDILERAKSDPGAPFEADSIEMLRSLKAKDPAEWFRFRASIKRGSGDISVKELDHALAGGTASDRDVADHLEIARRVRANIGVENVLFAQSSFWRWRETGVWALADDREIKGAVHAVLEQQFESQSVSRNTVDGVTDVLKTEAFCPDHRFDFVSDAINVLNGELNWNGKTWELEPHRREHFRTTQLPVAYDSNASAPRFEQFLAEVFEGDEDAEEKAILVCALIGYSLLTSSKYETFALLIGTGANGKSKLLEVLAALVGPDHVAAVQPSQFDNRFQRAHLRGKLVNIVTEVAEGAEIADAQLKAIVSGELTTAEHKHKPPFEFHPYATCWFGTNHMPHTRDFSNALFRRAVILTFNNTFYGGRRDPHLGDKLKSELPGILNLALEALAGVIERGGFTDCPSSQVAKQEWRLEADQVAQFVEEQCERAPGREITSAALYSAYQEWAQDAGIVRKLNRKNFTARLKRLGITPKKGTGGTRLPIGISLRRGARYAP
jgi:putative DNA primase/helicase